MIRNAFATSLLGFIILLPSAFVHVCVAKTSESTRAILESQITQDDLQTPNSAQLLNSAEQYLQLARSEDPSKNEEYQLMAADYYAQAGDVPKAKAIVEKVRPNNQSPELETLHKIVLAEVAINEENPKLAQSHLSNINERRGLTQSSHFRVLQLQTKTYERTRQYFLAAKTRSAMDRYITDSRSKMQNRQIILQHLSRLSPQQLSRSSRTASYPFSGWLSLAYVAKMQRNPRVFNQLLSTWQRDFPNHPGQTMIRNPNQRYADQSTRRQAQYYTSAIRHVALLLPLAGPHSKAAKAIREGFLAAYYESAGGKPSIKIYDTGEDVREAYKKAIREGADFVVGPLTKRDVYVLSNTKEIIRTPILALNEHPEINPEMRSFVQFSLAPEEEAHQIIQRAKYLNHHHASVVVTNNSWGDRLAKYFRSEWQEEGGNLVSQTKIDAARDLSAQIRGLLGIDDSQKRCTAIKNAVKEKVEYQLRRRQDIDVIFMALPSNLARQIKPLFDFYYAQDIPILATSSIYNGSPNPQNDSDMQGIKFVEMPWVVEPHKSSEVKALINRYHGNELGENTRLFAMGMDAYKLTRGFNELHQSRAYINGATGVLTLGKDNRIDRKLSWAVMENGKPQLLSYE